jgi:endonuclease YncB( thermonuclease family)
VVSGRDVAALLVEAGWALALPQGSRHYIAYEENARAAQRGVWQGTIEPPWEWRQKQK